MDIKVVESQNEIYQKQKLLGEGAFGKAYLVIRKADSELLVIKQMNIDHMSEQQKKQTIKEAQILRNLNHPNIVKFVEVYVTKQNKLKIVMEYAECGDLSKAISERKKSKKYFEQNCILDWFTQICLAIKHVHDRKILHRDIKGQNIFITKTNTLKLGDFGIARVLNKTFEKARTVVGTPYYLSPQIIENKPYSFQSDIWSIGVVLYQLCALTHPFTANSLQFLALKIVKGSFTQIPNQYSKQLRSLVGSMLALDPNRRPTISQIFKNPLIQDRIKNFLTQTKRDHQFSHTILHNHKVQILTNRLVQIKQQKDFQKQRKKLKQQQQLLRQRLQQKKGQQKSKQQQQERQKAQKQKQLQRQRQRQIQKQRQKQKQEQNRKAILQKQKQRRDFQRKQSVFQQQRKKQQEQKNMQRQYEERNKMAKFISQKRKQQGNIQRLRQEHAQLMYRQSQKQQQFKKAQKVKKAMEKQQEQDKKKKQLQQFARKQFFQNQQIMKRAKERAQQQQRGYQQNYENSPESQKLHNFGNKNTSENFHYQNKNQVNIQAKKPYASKQDFKGKQQMQKKYIDSRQKMKKDRQNFLKNKNHNKNQVYQQIASPEKNQAQKDLKTVKAAKWQRPNSRGKQSVAEDQTQNVQQVNLSSQKELNYQQLSDNSYNFMHEKISPQDEQNFNQYLLELENILQNVNKNVQAMENNQNKSPRVKFEEPEGPKQKIVTSAQKQNIPENKQIQISKINQILADFPQVQQVIYRDDDENTFQLSLTANFQKQGDKKSTILPQIQASTDLDYFSNFSKLQTLKMNLEDKFGTDKFVQLYRFLQNQMQQKGLQAFSNISSVVSEASRKFTINQNLLMDSFTLLLTLVHMEQRMLSNY